MRLVAIIAVLGFALIALGTGQLGGIESVRQFLTTTKQQQQGGSGSMTTIGAHPVAAGLQTAGHPVDAIIRYRISVVVSVDGKPYTGEAVQELGIYENPIPGLVPNRINLYLRGEALVMNLDGDRRLLIPLGRSYKSLIAFSCGVSWEEHRTPSSYAAAVKALGHPCQVPKTAMPYFVCLLQPETLDGARAGRLADFTTVLGLNTEIVSILIEPTDDKLTEGLISTIAWTSGLVRREILTVEIPSRPVPALLHRYDLVRENFQ